MKHEFSRQSFENGPNMKFYQNPSIGIRVVRCRWTDTHEEPNNHVSQLCESAPKISIMALLIES